MIWIYRILIFPLLLLIQIIRPFLNEKLKVLVEEKNLGRFRRLRPEGKINSPIWIHAASGEIEYAKPLIRQLKQQFPELQILLTFTSPSAIPLIEKIKEVDFWGPLPWEFSSEMQSFLNFWNPRVLLVARTDAWPEMMEQVSLKQIPSYLFAATFADNSSRFKWPISILTKATLKKFSGIFVVSEPDLKNLKSLGGSWDQAVVLGDTRFDQVFYRLSQESRLPEIGRPTKKTFLLGSTWAEDEAQLLPEVTALVKNGFQVIIAPHELVPSHVQTLQHTFLEQGFQVQKFSQLVTSEWDVLILDQMGVLAELYQWADFAFIGGSFRSQVHSVMEALAAGCAVFVGPHHRNNREAIEFQKFQPSNLFPAVQAIEKGSELTRRVLAIKSQDLEAFRPALRAEIQKHQGTSEKLISRIPQSLWQ